MFLVAFRPMRWPRLIAVGLLNAVSVHLLLRLPVGIVGLHPGSERKLKGEPHRERDARGDAQDRHVAGKSDFLLRFEVAAHSRGPQH